jgi:hypothetical protein
MYIYFNYYWLSIKSYFFTSHEQLWRKRRKEKDAILWDISNETYYHLNEYNIIIFHGWLLVTNRNICTKVKKNEEEKNDEFWPEMTIDEKVYFFFICSFLFTGVCKSLDHNRQTIFTCLHRFSFFLRWTFLYIAFLRLFILFFSFHHYLMIS